MKNLRILYTLLLLLALCGNANAGIVVTQINGLMESATIQDQLGTTYQIYFQYGSYDSVPDLDKTPWFTGDRDNNTLATDLANALAAELNAFNVAQVQDANQHRQYEYRFAYTSFGAGELFGNPSTDTVEISYYSYADNYGDPFPPPSEAWYVYDQNMNSTISYEQVYAYGNAIIPEPSTYAAIFGGLALTVATMRRKGRPTL